VPGSRTSFKIKIEIKINVKMAPNTSLVVHMFFMCGPFGTEYCYSKEKRQTIAPNSIPNPKPNHKPDPIWKEYPAALSDLDLLLSLPSTLVRSLASRGELYERKIVDLKHMKRFTEALACSLFALEEEDIQGMRLI